MSLSLETKRLYLVPWKDSMEDASGLYEYAKDYDVGPNAGWKPHESIEESLDIIRTLFMPHNVFSIRQKIDGKIIGSIGLENDKRREDVKSMEMGYSLGKAYWGKGYMTEAAREVISFGFKNYNLVIMSICTGPENKRSQRVIEKCGFKFEGIQRRGYHIYDGTDRDNLVYSMLREEWEELSKNW